MRPAVAVVVGRGGGSCCGRGGAVTVAALDARHDRGRCRAPGRRAACAGGSCRSTTLRGSGEGRGGEGAASKVGVGRGGEGAACRGGLEGAACWGRGEGMSGDEDEGVGVLLPCHVTDPREA